MKTKPLMLALTSAAVLWCGPAAPSTSAQPVIPPPTPAYYQPLSDQQLDQLLGPVALYPDPLLAVLLPAATFPAQIVLADRYVMSGGDPGQIDWQPWDPSVQALAHYPSVLKYMDDNLGWTTELGQAFLYQQPQVMDAIQRLRVSAQNFGNLVSTPQEEVADYGGDIEILPTEPDVLYVPVYQPAYVYCRSGFGWGFGIGFTFGPWLDCDFDWHRHHLCFWDHDHPRPSGWWHARPEWRDNWIAHEGTVWHPGDHRDAGRNYWSDRDGRDRNHRDNGEWNRNDNRNWNRPDDRSWNQAVNHAPPAHHNSVVWMSGSGANHPSRSIYVATPSAPSSRPDYNRGAFAGGGRSRDAGSFNNYGREATPTVSRPEQTWSAPARSEPVYSEPARSAPSVSYSHPAPSYQGGGGGGGYRGGGGGGGGNGGGGGFHGGGSQSSSRH